MENLNTMITDMLGPFGPLMLVGMLGVFLILLTLPILLKKQADPLDRLKSSSRKEGKKGEQLRGAQSMITWKSMQTFWSRKTAKNTLRLNSSWYRRVIIQKMPFGCIILGNFHLAFWV